MVKVFLRNVDQDENVHELCQMRSETESVVSINESFGDDKFSSQFYGS